MKFESLLAVMAALALGGCDFAPLYNMPDVALSVSFKDTAGATGNAYLLPAWWTSFGDPRLDQLEALVDTGNPDIAAAIASNDIAQARAKIALSNLFPELDAAGHLYDNKQSDNRPLRSKSQPTFFGDNEIAGQISYELDIWGRVRDLAKAAAYTSEAANDALAQAKLELHAELARAYVDLRGIDDEAKLLSDTIKLYQSALDLTQTRLAALIAPPIDVERAKTQLNAVQAQAADLALRRETLEDAIAALVGKSASSFRLPQARSAFPLPRRPRAAPGDVLRRRPDVAEAERLAAAASEDIGAAKAALYPRFSMDLLFGTQDTGIRLLNPGNTLFTIGPAVDFPLFDAGLRKAELEVANSAFTRAAEQYRSNVLLAVREVQDSVAALHWLADESAHTAAEAAAARKAADMSMALYRDGAASFLDVYTAEGAALEAERLAISLHTREVEASIDLILALGGGWSRPIEPPPPTPDLVPAWMASAEGSKL